MSDGFDALSDRARQIRAALRQTNGDTGAAGRARTARGGCTFCAGDRVFDRVLGLEGIVLGSEREHLLMRQPVPAGAGAAAGAFHLPESRTIESVTVQLAGGRLVKRAADELVLRPTPPEPRK